MNKISLIIKSNINKSLAIKMASKIKNTDNLAYALNLIKKIEDENKRKLFECIACNENLQKTKLYKDVLDIAFEEEKITLVERILRVLCNDNVIECQCYEAIIRLILSSRQQTGYILDIVESLVLHCNIKPTINIFRRLMNLNQLLIRRMCILLENNYMDTEKLYNIFIKLLIATKDININEQNLETIVFKLEKLLHINNKEAVNILLSTINLKIEAQLINNNNNNNNIIDINLPNTINIETENGYKTYKINR